MTKPNPANKIDPATKAAIKALVDAAVARKGTTIRDVLATVLAGPGADLIRQTAARQIKARILAQRFKDNTGKNPAGVLTVQPTGTDQEVAIAQVTYGEADDVSWVDVYTAGQTQGGDPHFRIINPPTLVEDPAGDIVVTSTPRPGRKPVTRRFREDPLGAIAQAIAAQGGARR